MSRGGARAGAGRKKGSPNSKTAELQERIAASGLTPLDCMIETMRGLWEENRRTEASAIAKDAAPYVHARLAAVEHTGEGGGPIQVNITGDDASLL